MSPRVNENMVGFEGVDDIPTISKSIVSNDIEVYIGPYRYLV